MLTKKFSNKYFSKSKYDVLEVSSSKSLKKELSIQFPKDFKLKKRREYQEVLKERQAWVGSLIFINYKFTNNTHPKLGITVSSKFGKAIKRNQFKRVVREAFRLSWKDFPKSIILSVYPKFSKKRKDFCFTSSTNEETSKKSDPFNSSTISAKLLTIKKEKKYTTQKLQNEFFLFRKALLPFLKDFELNHTSSDLNIKSTESSN